MHGLPNLKVVGCWRVSIVSLYDCYEDLHCMQDGALPHFAWLDSHFTGGWIGRCGPTLWRGVCPKRKCTDQM